MVGPDSVQESYIYDSEGTRWWRGSGVPWRGTLGGVTRSLYLFNGKPVAQRAVNGGTATVTYLHGDHLGSVSVVTDNDRRVLSRQDDTPSGV